MVYGVWCMYGMNTLEGCEVTYECVRACVSGGSRGSRMRGLASDGRRMTMTDDDGWIGGWHTRARACACVRACACARVCIYVVYTRRTLSGVVCDLTRFDLI